jgi:hypothetical protein
VAFSTIGLAGVVIASTPSLALRGGLVSTGLYVLALQVVVSALALSAIDDSRDPQMADPGPEHWWQAKGAPPATAAFQLRRALWYFHLWRLLPAALLAFGLSVSLSLIAIGAFDRGPGVGVRDTFGSALDDTLVRRSELALGAVLLLTVLFVLRRRGVGRHGWVVGFAAGVVITKEGLSAGLSLVATSTSWALFSAALLTCLLISTVVDLVLSRRRAKPA